MAPYLHKLSVVHTSPEVVSKEKVLRKNSTKYLGRSSDKNDDLVPQSIIFSLGQWKYHLFKKKDVEMPHFVLALRYKKFTIVFRFL